ncbi:hypothetical protein B296_00032053, partial [Ensete ventricosum]
ANIVPARGQALPLLAAQPPFAGWLQASALAGSLAAYGRPYRGPGHSRLPLFVAAFTMKMQQEYVEQPGSYTNLSHEQPGSDTTIGKP